jgi:hypothetical protein
VAVRVKVEREAVSGPNRGDERARRFGGPGLVSLRVGGPGLVSLRDGVPSRCGCGEVDKQGGECEQGSHEQQIGRRDRSR